MKKALIIAYNDLNNSGVPNVIYQTIKALHERYSFDVLIFGEDDYYCRRLEKEETKINLIRYVEKKPNNKIARFFWWFYKRPYNHYLFMKNLFNDNKYSVIHSFKEYDSWPFFKAAKEANIQTRIYHCNVNLSLGHFSINSFIRKRNMRLSLKYSSSLVGVSELSCKNAFSSRKFTVLHNSFDGQKYNADVKCTLSNDEFVITQVASYSDNKNQLFTLQVIKEIKKLHSNVRLNLVGATSIDSYYKRLMEYVENNNLKDNVAFVTKCDNVNDIYEKTSLIVIPSYKEGFSLVAVEAQACGITVFASSNVTNEINCGGVHFLDLSKGPAYWAQEIYNYFMKYKNQRTEYDVSKFSFERFKKQIEDLYNGK